MLEVQLFDKLNKVDFVNSYQFPIRISLNSEEYPNNGDKYIFNRFFDALPGDFIVNVLLTDLNTKNKPFVLQLHLFQILLIMFLT